MIERVHLVTTSATDGLPLENVAIARGILALAAVGNPKEAREYWSAFRGLFTRSDREKIERELARKTARLVPATPTVDDEGEFLASKAWKYAGYVVLLRGTEVISVGESLEAAVATAGAAASGALEVRILPNGALGPA